MRLIRLSRSLFGDGVYSVTLLGKLRISLQFRLWTDKLSKPTHSFSEMDAMTKQKCKISPANPWFGNGRGVVFDPENYGVVSVETYKREE